MKKKNLQVIFMLAAFTVMFGSNIICSEYYSNKEFENYQTFNSTNIKGEVTKIRLSSGSLHLKIDTLKFSIRPIPNEIGIQNSLHNIIQDGDTLIKSAYSDTIILKRNKIIRYFNYTYPYTNQ